MKTKCPLIFKLVDDDDQIIEFVDSLSPDVLQFFSVAFIANDLKHYVSLQSEWLLDEQYFLGTKLHRSPTMLEVLSAWELHKNAERFRVYYVLKFPEKVKFISQSVPKFSLGET